MKEEWKPIQNYEKYLISNFGNVFSLVSNKNLKPDINHLGYKRVVIRNDKNDYRVSIHRLVAHYFLPQSKDITKLIVNHLDNNPGNNYYLNLEWTDYSGNAIHARDTGRLNPPIGKMNGMSKINDRIAIKVIELWNSGLTQSSICNKLNLGMGTVQKITQGTRWKHLQHLNVRKKCFEYSKEKNK